MARLRAIIVAAALLWAAPAAADPLDRWSPYIAEASARFGVPEAWIRRVMRAESGGRTIVSGRPIVSRAGAMGLMQLMPGTWREMRSLLGLGHDAHEPRDNILAGTAYLRAMYDRFGYPGLFAAYNAGPGRYAEHLATGRRLPAETVAYVASVGRAQPEPPTLRQEPRTDSIFVVLAAMRPRDAIAAPPQPPSRSLFVPLTPASHLWTPLKTQAAFSEVLA
ncbi:MAG: lytic transglycosylase domain-containing protein [Sphingosinicella sp.]|uniref:lytic transglycosylase domain-containing protein n=1 Tax=Sphingosinicella sp. TaxID=1917971 RepID=UPI004037ED6C